MYQSNFWYVYMTLITGLTVVFGFFVVVIFWNIAGILCDDIQRRKNPWSKKSFNVDRQYKLMTKNPDLAKKLREKAK